MKPSVKQAERWDDRWNSAPPELEMTSHSCWILKIPTLIYIYIHLNTFMTFNWIVVESCAKPTAQFHNPSPSQHLMGARFTIPSPPSCEASKDAVVSSHSVLDTLMHLKSAGAQGATGNVRESEPNWEFPSLRKVFGVARQLSNLLPGCCFLGEWNIDKWWVIGENHRIIPFAMAATSNFKDRPTNHSKRNHGKFLCFFVLIPSGKLT